MNLIGEFNDISVINGEKMATKFLDKNLDIPVVVRSVRMYLKTKTHFWRWIVPERIWLFVRICQIDGIKYQSLFEQHMEQSHR